MYWNLPAAWKASAKKWRKHSIAVDDYWDAQVAYQHSLEYSQHTSWKRAEAAEKRVAELEEALKEIEPFAACLCFDDYKCHGCGISEAIEKAHKALNKSK